jgi:hypothetical protein
MESKIIKLMKKEKVCFQCEQKDIILNSGVCPHCDRLNRKNDYLQNDGTITITKDNIHLYYEFMSDKDLKKHQDLFVCVYCEGNVGENWKIVDPKYINWSGWFYVINLDNKAIAEYLIKSQNKQSFDFNLLKNEFSEMAINQFQKI